MLSSSTANGFTGYQHIVSNGQDNSLTFGDGIFHPHIADRQLVMKYCNTTASYVGNTVFRPRPTMNIFLITVEKNYVENNCFKFLSNLVIFVCHP